MAFDGLTVHAVVNELNTTLSGCRIVKIAQPEDNEIILTIKGSCGQKRLLISANASLPLVYLLSENKPSPDIAPNFCMVLRKHLSNGRIISISQPDFERIIHIDIEHLDEMGDLCKKTLVIELMGKHSNIIFIDDKGMIIDSIKHISGAVSSIREVLPGRDYFVPNTMDKINPLEEIEKQTFVDTIFNKHTTLTKAIYTAFTGVSPVIANEIVYNAGLDGDCSVDSINSFDSLYDSFNDFICKIKSYKFKPTIFYSGDTPIEFCPLALNIYNNSDKKEFESISEMLRHFYAEKNIVNNIRQRSADLRHILNTALERNSKKLDIQLRQLKDTEKKDKFKIYGELIHTYGYSAKQGDKELNCINYYNNEEITIPLDPLLSPMDNAKKYFDKYNKLKRTEEALGELIENTKMDLEHVNSVLNALDIARTLPDLNQIKEEMALTGLIKKNQSNKRKENSKSKPLHYISSDGFDIYVGKNNLQNDEITFKLGNANDWWFHAKKIPGSHVLLRAKGEVEIPDRAFEEAAAIAAYYSKGSNQTLVEIDYLKRKDVKKPNGAKPGFVVYYTNYSLSIAPSIANLTLAD